jgi:hypothetical protein
LYCRQLQQHGLTPGPESFTPAAGLRQLSAGIETQGQQPALGFGGELGHGLLRIGLPICSTGEWPQAEQGRQARPITRADASWSQQHQAGGRPWGPADLGADGGLCH